MENSPLLEREEAAKFLRLSLRKLDDIKVSGKIDFVKVGRKTLYTELALKNFIEANTVRAE